AIHHGPAVGVHLDELDAHAGGLLARGVIFLAGPNDAPHALDQRRLVLELELELQQRAHRHRLARLDEDAPAGNVSAVLLDEFVGGRALDPALQRPRGALALARVGHPPSSVPPLRARRAAPELRYRNGSPGFKPTSPALGSTATTPAKIP